jgi:hypothetical protein
MRKLTRGGALVVMAQILQGCVYVSGSIDYAGQPELRSVLLYTGRPDERGEQIAALVKEKRSWESCDDLAHSVLLDLLADARALDATGVKDVRFRGRWHWMGRVVCRASLLGRSIQVRGIAYRE